MRLLGERQSHGGEERSRRGGGGGKRGAFFGWRRGVPSAPEDQSDEKEKEKEKPSKWLPNISP